MFVVLIQLFRDGEGILPLKSIDLVLLLLAGVGTWILRAGLLQGSPFATVEFRFDLFAMDRASSISGLISILLSLLMITHWTFERIVRKILFRILYFFLFLGFWLWWWWLFDWMAGLTNRIALIFSLRVTFFENADVIFLFSLLKWGVVADCFIKTLIERLMSVIGALGKALTLGTPRKDLKHAWLLASW